MSIIFFFSSRRRHTRCGRDWSSDVCSSDLTYTNFDIGLRGLWTTRTIIIFTLLTGIFFIFVADKASIRKIEKWYFRSEERRVGKECRFWWSRYHYKRKKLE